MKHTAVALLRLSTEEQAAEGKCGLLRQQEEIRLAAARWNLTVTKSFNIIDVSGTQVAESPEFRDMIEALRSPTVHGLVVAAIDRLMRPDDFSSFSIYDFFAEHGKFIWTPSSLINVSEDSGFLEALVQGMMAGLDRRRILRNTQTAKEAKRKLGRCANAKITLPQGIDFDFKTGKWSYIEPFASRVKDAFSLFLTGNYSVRHIAKMLGYSSPRTLYNHLRNPIWCGIREYRFRRGSEKYPSQGGRQADRKKVLREVPLRIELDIAPLITQESYKKTQEILLAQRNQWKSARSESSRFELSGMLYCQCGKRMYSKSAGRRGRQDTYYCSSRHNAKGCGSPHVGRKQMDYTVASFVSDVLRKPKVLESLLQSVEQRKGGDELSGKIEQARTDVGRLKEEKRKLLKLAVSGAFSEDEIEYEARRIDAESARCNTALIKIERELAARTFANTRAVAESIVSVFAEFEYLQPSKRKSLLKKFVRRITTSEGSIRALEMWIPGIGDKTCIPTGRGSSRSPA